jgi:hypothetical protein
MDTKSLHDALLEDGFNLSSYESHEYEDAVATWITYMLTPAILKGYLGDWMFDLSEDTMAFGKLCNEMKGGVADVQNIVSGSISRSPSLSLTHTYGFAAVMRFDNVGSQLSFHLLKSATKYVEENASEWFLDVWQYASDMAESHEEARGDYEYDQRKDRTLDERA